MVVVLGADVDAVAGVLERLGNDDLVVLDGSPGRLEALLDALGDPRVWLLIGDAQVIPLPDRSVDEVVGAGTSSEVARVLR
jgi:ubiquinone/menaquinone biosynthesis C-methylase UbiE